MNARFARKPRTMHRFVSNLSSIERSKTRSRYTAWKRRIVFSLLKPDADNLEDKFPRRIRRRWSFPPWMKMLQEKCIFQSTLFTFEPICLDVEVHANVLLLLLLLLFLLSSSRLFEKIFALRSDEQYLPKRWNGSVRVWKLHGARNGRSSSSYENRISRRDRGAKNCIIVKNLDDFIRRLNRGSLYSTICNSNDSNSSSGPRHPFSPFLPGEPLRTSDETLSSA